MELHLSICMMSLILFVGVLSASTTSVTPDETYWNKVLPKTPMPSAVKSSLQSVGYHGKASPFRVSGIPPSISLQVYTRSRCPMGNSGANDFMLETQLVPERTIEVPLTSTRAEYKATFLPRKVSDSIPFSSDKLPEILDRFSVRPKSKEAVAMENTIRECQYAKDGETIDKAYCATSLKGMVSFVKSYLRDERVNAFSSSPPKRITGDHSDGKNEYNITGVKLLSEYGSIVSCHKQDYPYAVFYCHVAKNAAPYMVSLTSKKGMDDRKKLAVCHKDTSWWDPNHIAFKVLKSKPGTPICHFLGDLAVVWTHK